MKFLITAILCINALLPFISMQKEYIKQVDDNGQLISEGWVLNGVKDGYWKFYAQQQLKQAGHYSNDQKTGYWHEYLAGKISSEGHYKDGLKAEWWTYHNKNGYRLIKKQFKKGLQHGYVLYYKNATLSMVEEYKSSEKIGVWTSYFKFKRDHPGFSMSDLR